MFWLILSLNLLFQRKNNHNKQRKPLNLGHYMLMVRPMRKAWKIGTLLKSLNGELIEPSLCFNFKASNNEVEHETLILGLRLALSLVKRLRKCSITWLF